MRKRLLSIVSSMIVVCMFLVSCQEVDDAIPVQPKATESLSQPSGDSQSDTEIIETGEEGEETSPVEFDFWHPFSGIVAEEIEQIIQQFNDQKQGQIVVNVDAYSDTEILHENLMGAIEQQENIPDLILAPSYELSDLYRQGEIIEIDENELKNTNGENEIDIFPIFLNIDMADNKRFGIPFYQSANFIFYNQSWGEEIGFAVYPKTMKDFSDVICTAYLENRFDDESANDGTGGYFYPTGSLPFLSWMNGFGGGTLYNNRNELLLNREENIVSLIFLYESFYDGCSWWTAKEDNPYRYFAERYTIAYSGSVENIFAQQFVFDDVSSDDKWILIPYPSIQEKPIIFFDNYSLAMMNLPEINSDALLEFINWMIEPSNHAEIVYKAGVFPLSATEIREIDNQWSLFDVWNSMLQYIPFMQPVPPSSKWYITDRVLSDVGWQIIQYGTAPDNISEVLTSAEILVNTWE